MRWRVSLLISGTLLFGLVIYNIITNYRSGFDFSALDLILFITSQILIYLYFRPNRLIHNDNICITVKDFEIPDLERVKKLIKEKYDIYLSYALGSIEADVYLNNEKFIITTMKEPIETESLREGMNNWIEEEEILNHKYHTSITLVPSKGKRIQSTLLLLQLSAIVLTVLTNAQGVYFETLTKRGIIVHKVFSKDHFIDMVDNKKYNDLLG